MRREEEKERRQLGEKHKRTELVFFGERMNCSEYLSYYIVDENRSCQSMEM